jgi:hypothetical protein
VLFVLLGLLASAPWEAHADVGGEVSAKSFGVLDVGVRSDRLSIELLTDTLELRYAEQTRSDRRWIALRAEAAAAGLFISPWTAGAPDPRRALYASYVGVDLGWQQYLPFGFYAGVEGWARAYFFHATSTTEIAVPSLSSVESFAARIGWWAPAASLWVRAGSDVHRSSAQPTIRAEALVHPSWLIAPRIELRTGWARGEDDITRTRLGGLNPYVVPLAGAAWAEWWVESYVALRAGAAVNAEWGSVAAVVDAARFDGMSAYGVAVLGHVAIDVFFVEASTGWAPSIARAPGVARVAGFILVGTSWIGI